MSAAKKSAPVPLKKTRRVIQLDASQYALYQSGQLDIYAPDGQLLDSIGTEIDRFEADTHASKLHDQLSLVEALVVTSSGELQLSERALAGLANLLYQSSELIR